MRNDRAIPAAILLILLLLAACATPKGIYHVVQPGQTLYSISRAYNVNEQYLARLNNIDDPLRLRTGQKMFVPGATRRIEVPVPRPAKNQPGVARPTLKTVPPSSLEKTPQTRSVDIPQQAAGPIPKVVKDVFAWPLKGDLLRGFGLSENRHCNGLEIAAPEGTPVLAAAAGQVTYSGDGIRGYGNLIIIRHEDSFYSVYGYNKKNLVASGVMVKKGEKIAFSGTSPVGGAPCLHFEIRQGKAAVNPIFYLP